MAAKKTPASSASKKAKFTAPRGEKEMHSRARTDAAIKPGRSRTGSDRGTEDRAGKGDSGKRSAAEHSEHPENPGDSTVRHAEPQAGGKSQGARGFPQGEYDVVKPKSEPGRKQTVKDTLLEQHAGEQDVEVIERALKHPNANRLSAQERALAGELLPIGAVIEHEAENRWRVRGPLGQGGPRFGHGSTLAEAIDSYVLGNPTGTDAQASADRFSNLPASVQREIEERDKAAAKAVGQDPENAPDIVARRQNLENAKAAAKRLASPVGAASDGAEVGNAVNEAGRKRGERNRTQAAGRTRSKSKK